MGKIIPKNTADKNVLKDKNISMFDVIFLCIYTDE